MNRRNIIVPVLAVVTAGAVALGASQVSAQETTDGYPSIVAKIAERFNLNQDDVKAVFDEEKTEMMEEMKARNEERLAEAVAAGEITEEQKQLILDKQAELHAKRQSERADMQSLTEEERKAAMQAKRDEMDSRRTELETWAQENGIDMKYLMMGGRRGHGFGGPGRFDKGDDSLVDSQTEVEQE